MEAGPEMNPAQVDPVANHIASQDGLVEGHAAMEVEHAEDERVDAPDRERGHAEAP
jgi:hypothetical protein